MVPALGGLQQLIRDALGSSGLDKVLQKYRKLTIYLFVDLCKYKLVINVHVFNTITHANLI